MRILLLLPLLAACSAGTPPDAASSSAALAQDIQVRNDGPIRLQGTCTVGTETIVLNSAGVDQPYPPSGTTLGKLPQQLPGSASHDSIYLSTEIVSAPRGQYDVTLRTMLAHPWAGDGFVQVTVKKNGLGANDTVRIDDPTSLPGKPIACTVKLAPQPTIHLTADMDPVATNELKAPRLVIDLPLPSHVSCGIALRFPGALGPEALGYFNYKFTVTGDYPVVTTRDDDHTIAFRMPQAHGWDAFLESETSDHTQTFADGVREMIGQDGTLENIDCPTN